MVTYHTNSIYNDKLLLLSGMDSDAESEDDILSNAGNMADLLERTRQDVGEAIRPPENFRQSPGD